MNLEFDFNKFCAGLDENLTQEEIIKSFEQELFETQRLIQLRKTRSRENRHFTVFFAQNYATNLEQALNRLKGHDQGYVFSQENQASLDAIRHRIEKRAAAD